MPMIDVYATEGTFARPHDLARDLAAAVMRWEEVPDLAMFRNNTAAFVHEHPAGAISNVAGEGDYVPLKVGGVSAVSPIREPILPKPHAASCPNSELRFDDGQGRALVGRRRWHEGAIAGVDI